MSTGPEHDPEVQPSSTPDGPQVVPSPSTPAGEPGPDTEHEQVHFDNRSSNPSSGGEAGLAGDLGISSERTGPGGDDPRSVGAGQGGVEGTGSVGQSITRTDGESDTSRQPWDAADVSQSDLHPERDEERDDTRGVNEVRDDHRAGVDRTVGEPRPNSIPDEKSRR